MQFGKHFGPQTFEDLSVCVFRCAYFLTLDTMFRGFLLALLLSVVSSQRCADGQCEETSFLQGMADPATDEALLEDASDWNGPRRAWPRRRYSQTYDLPTLSKENLTTIEANCKKGVEIVNSTLRYGGVKVVMQIVVMPRATPSQPLNLWDVGARPYDSAILGSRDIARGKAYTALGFSSNENALSSAQIGAAAQPGAGLYGIQNTNRQYGAGVVTFGGGIPLYDDGKLVGAVGVSGDGVIQDEEVALACATGFEPPAMLVGAGFVDANATNPLSP